MSGLYTVQFTGVAVTAQQDFFELVAHSSKQCRLLGFGLYQSTEVGDAQEEGLSILVKSGQTTSGTPSTAATPALLDPVLGATAGFTCEINNTTKASAGTILTHYAYCWNVRMPLEIVYPSQWAIVFGAGRRMTIELATTPADSITINGYAVVEEIG